MVLIIVGLLFSLTLVLYSLNKNGCCYNCVECDHKCQE